MRPVWWLAGIAAMIVYLLWPREMKVAPVAIPAPTPGVPRLLKSPTLHAIAPDAPRELGQPKAQGETR